jgi:hypothetical protein
LQSNRDRRAGKAGGRAAEDRLTRLPPPDDGGSVRVGRDAGRIADEIVSHLTGLMNSTVKITLEIEAEIPSGAPDHVVRTVTKNCRTLEFTSQGFETD